MARTIRTKAFTIDRASYLRTTWILPLVGRMAFLGAGLAILVVFGFATHQRGFAYGGLIGGAIGLPLALTARYAMDRRRIYGKATGQAFDDPRTMEFTEKEFRIRTEGGVESKVPWSHVQRARRRGGFTLMAIAPNFVPIPDSAFSTDEDREALWGLLREKGLAKKG